MASRVSSIDQGFVPSEPEGVYARLEDVARYGEWWPGVRASEGPDGVTLALDGRRPVRVTPEARRPGTGLVLRFGGPAYEGTLEWYLERDPKGTIVTAIGELLPRRRWGHRRTLRFRAAVRRGLVGLRAAAEA